MKKKKKNISCGWWKTKTAVVLDDCCFRFARDYYRSDRRRNRHRKIGRQLQGTKVNREKKKKNYRGCVYSRRGHER